MQTRTWLAALAAVMLSACGGTQISALVLAHTACAPDYYASPAWTPDAKRIDYVVARAGVNAIHAMTALGGGDHVLIAAGTRPLPSPDGCWLLFVGGSARMPATPPYGLLDLASGQVRSLGDLGDAPAWSPDGRWIAYSLSGGGPLMRLDPAGGQASLLDRAAGQSASDTTPVWSPDGQAIAFASDRDGPIAVYVMKADGSGIRRLSGGAGAVCPLTGQASTDTPVAWQPDPGGGGTGQALLVAASCGSGSVLHLVTLDGHEISGRSYLNRAVVSAGWSPDGREVMLYLDALGQPDIALADAAASGSALRVLRGDASDPSWSPDGKEIAFVGADSAGMQEVYTIRPDGSGLAQITSNPGAGRVCLH